MSENREERRSNKGKNSESDEIDDDPLVFHCLFCPSKVSSYTEFVSHSQLIHNFTFPPTLVREIYGRIKLINYLRTQTKKGITADLLLSQVENDISLFQSEEWLKPALENDAVLLSLQDEDDSEEEEDMESEEESDDESDEDDNDDDFNRETTGEKMKKLIAAQEAKKKQRQAQQQHPPKKATETILNTDITDLSNSARSSAEVEELREALQTMRLAMQRLTYTSASNSKRRGYSDSSDNESRTEEEKARSRSSTVTAIQPFFLKSTSASLSFTSSNSELSVTERLHLTRREEDAGYFNGYSTRYIHEIMLKDSIRTLAYRDFIYNNNDLFKDKVVLDVGCGTGILSLFAAKAGAKLVIGVDAADIADKAREIVAFNKYSNVVTIIKGRMEDVSLPVPYVDIIISEWMGYFLLFESMLPAVLFARDKYLQPTSSPFSQFEKNVGLTGVYPNFAQMDLCGAERSAFKADKIEFWKNCYGFDFSLLIDEEEKYKGYSVETVKESSVITTSCSIKSIDVMKIKAEELDFTTPFTIEFTKKNRVDAFVVYFNTDFTLHCTAPVTLTTSPYSPPTHWMQTVFNLQESLEGNEGEKISGIFTGKRMKVKDRCYSVTIQYWKEMEDPQKFLQSFTVE